MYTLEPLCDLEQSQLLKELGFREEVRDYWSKYHEQGKYKERTHGICSDDHNEYDFEYSRPTISMARNWVYEKYKLWMETNYSPETQTYYSRIWTELPLPFIGNNDNPIIAESECLTQILKHLKNKAND